ncbi:glycogen/starch/alpha-glucan phosphorylase [Culicoidibacter larvae]|uniref:Alpha-1,4 glucan phosphorylase n=1 Tax=Culicoidibacter larvae TaxID=2579976 RepID=A0A5R8QDX9_9FIRM|nr:glycogen/starch/alpha-glucan phosphorylase [Culicoidibacter larvae]TLG75441.1 glycogen/starch/alpha-glucan phosphorylase [Culicoidibacter larvae]
MNKQEFSQQFISRLKSQTGKPLEETTANERYYVLAELTKELITDNWIASELEHRNQKRVYYFSMEFLMGRLLTNNLQNMGYYHMVQEAMTEIGIDINTLENAEDDMGLGNGGLGRLAACFLDSAASLGYPVQGNTIRYQYGFFDQKIVEGQQIELAQQWLRRGTHEWEVCREDEAVVVNYGSGASLQAVLAVPYDLPIIGYNGKTINTLRMWSAQPVTEALVSSAEYSDYEHETRMITQFLYPDDSTPEGQRLRLRQQYFFSSAGAQALVRNHVSKGRELETFADYHTIQINDTHPTLVIPELVRIFVDEHGMGFEAAWKLVQQTVAYTNHTLLAEALEEWDEIYIQELFPRVYDIIVAIEKWFMASLVSKGYTESQLAAVKIIANGKVRMAYLAVVGSFSINGVAALHTDLLKNDALKQLFAIYPDRFNNKTNGVTQRRWLLYSNPELAKLITEKIGDAWTTDMENELLRLLAFIDDESFLDRLLEIKQGNKERLADYIEDQLGVAIDSSSIFDIQIKRLHAYKRQLMNVFHIIYLYQRLKTEADFTIVPRTFIFGAKAAASYVFAKEVIQLINVVADIVNNDPDVNKYLRVVFIPNYNVSKAELLFPAADVSEQISTAGKEASGTGNMKFMMNGAITLGTLDGANVEIHERVGDDNSFIFGLQADEVSELSNKHQDNLAIVAENKQYQKIMDFLKNPQDLGSSFVLAPDTFAKIVSDLIDGNDEYFVFSDLAAYIKAQEEIAEAYSNRHVWAKMMLVNIAYSGYFSSDRTIHQYAKDIWRLG